MKTYSLNHTAQKIDDLLEKVNSLDETYRGPRGYSGMNPTNRVNYASSVQLSSGVKTVITDIIESPLQITLGPVIEGYDNEWSIEFTIGSTARDDITVPDGTEYTLGMAPHFSANTTFELRFFKVGAGTHCVWSSYTATADVNTEE